MFLLSLQSNALTVLFVPYAASARQFAAIRKHA